MLGFIRISNRKRNKKSNLAHCARVAHADTVASYALSHSRVPFSNLSGRPITNLEVFYTNWSYNTSVEWSPTSTLSVRAAVEYPVGIITPLYDAGGNRDISISGGGIGSALKKSGLNIPANAVFYIRTRCIVTGGDGQAPRAYTNNATFNGGTIQSWFGATNDGSDYTTSGNQPTAFGVGFGPSAVCSRETGNKTRSFMIIGDSISRGNFSGGISFAEVAALGAGYSFLNFAVSGSKLVDNTVQTKRIALARATGCTDVLMNYPINDISGSKTLSNIQTGFNALWSNLKAAGFDKIIQASCTPRTSDATNTGTPYATPAGAFTGGASSLRSQVNAWLRSVAGQANKADYIFEFADVLESSRDSGLWLNPTVNTSDGLHPTATGATTAGNAYKTFLQTIGF